MKKQENLLKNQKGFTLIEIIAVLVILGILAAVAVPKFMDLQNKARVQAADQAIAETFTRLSNGFAIYLLKNNGVIPTSVAQICGSKGINDSKVLPISGNGNVPMGADYTVTLRSDGRVTVSKVQGVTINPPRVKTWQRPT